MKLVTFYIFVSFWGRRNELEEERERRRVEGRKEEVAE